MRRRHRQDRRRLPTRKVLPLRPIPCGGPVQAGWLLPQARLSFSSDSVAGSAKGGRRLRPLQGPARERHARDLLPRTLHECPARARASLRRPEPAPEGVACSGRWIDECQQLLQTGHDLLVELELLDDRIPGTEDPRQIPARVCQALHEAGANWIGRVEEHHRDPILGRRRRSLSSGDRFVLERNDDVHVVMNNLAACRSASPGSRLRHSSSIRGLRARPLEVSFAMSSSCGPSIHFSSTSRATSVSRDGGTWSVPTCIRPTRGIVVVSELVPGPGEQAPIEERTRGRSSARA